MTIPPMTIPQGRHNFPECPTCPYLLHDSWDVCSSCVSERHPPVANPCPICSQENSANFCQNSFCLGTEPRCFDNIYATTMYEKDGELAQKIKRYKYGNGVHCDTVWSIIFARMLIGYLENYRNPSAVDIIIPNPSNPGRNHIEIIFRRAAELSSGNRWNFDPADDPAVVKEYNTPRAAANNRLGNQQGNQQVAQWHAEVAKQHAKALRPMHPDRFRGKRVVVFDDICTTCHQINEVACLLKKWGATRVYGVVLARTRLQANKA